MSNTLDTKKIEAQAEDTGLFAFADRLFEQLDEANRLFPDLSMTVELRPFSIVEKGRDPVPSSLGSNRYFYDDKDVLVDDVLYLAAHSADVPHVYCGVNPKDHEGPQNRYKYAAPGGNEATPAVFNIVADLDFKHNNTEESRKEQLRNLPMKPWILVHSGRGLQGWFRLKIPTTDKDRCSRLMAGLAIQLGTDIDEHSLPNDEVKDAARVFRVPGTYNGKYDPKRLAYLITDPELTDPDARCTLEELELLVDPDDFKRVTETKSERTSRPRGGLSNTRSSTTEGGYLRVPEDGGRNNLLVRIGGYFAGEGLNPDLINANYHEINTNEHSPFDVAISDAEVDKISTSFKDGPDDPVTLSGADAKKVTGGWISWLKGRGLEPELVNDLMLLIRDHDEPLMQNLDYRRSGSVTKPLASMATGRRRPCMKTYSKTCLTDRATSAICWKQN